jgi:hypothetical protein
MEPTTEKNKPRIEPTENNKPRVHFEPIEKKKLGIER